MLRTATALLLCFSYACGDEDDVGSGGVSLSGSITGEAPPTAAKVSVVWSVSSGSPDYAYVFGDGDFSGGQFTLNFVEKPPVEALNSYGVGVGFVVLVPDDVEISEGVLDDESLPIQGISNDHSVLWIAPAASGPDWAEDFDTGYGCGACVPAAEGETFDSFEPVSCDEVVIDTGDVGVCNWT